MQTICPLCGGNEHATVSERDRHGGALRTVVCIGCGIITNDPIPSDAELAAFYTSSYRVAYKGAEVPRKRQVYRNFRRIAAHFKDNAAFYGAPMTGLDLGSGSGEFLFFARAAGLDFSGVEPNKGYASYSSGMLGLPVANKLLEELSFPAAQFDMIRLSHVLEHMRDPVRSLTTLRGWLKPGGLLYVEVPQIDAEARRKMRGRMFHFGHVFNFDPFTLRLAAALAGLVEHPDAARRLSGTTGTFFMAGDAPKPDAAAMAANGARMKALMDAHNASMMPAPEGATAAGRFLSVNAQRIAEQLAVLRFPSHRAIADHFGARAGRA
jgi:SAM-dependent methyltransferase